MIEHITKLELRRFGSSLTLKEQANIRQFAASRSLDGATFLSHSSKDEDLVIGAIHVLEEHGARVYTDKIDPGMPPYTSEVTAALLKRRILQTKRFVLLASDNSKESRWVPWELGVADGCKGLSGIALFPASEKAEEQSWASWEYLGLYRRIVWGDLGGHQNKVWMVLDERKNTATELKKWLRGQPSGI
jgi:hypothetical protein